MAESGMALVEQSRELDEPQQAALTALRAGQSFALAAEMAGVHRATVFRWVKRDPYFAAAFNAWKSELQASAEVRLLKLTDKAVDVVEKALERGDEQVAMKMLRQLQVMRRTKVGATDGETMKVEMDLQEKRRHRSQTREMARIMLEKSGLSPAEQRRYIRRHGCAPIVE
jgi:transposase